MVRGLLRHEVLVEPSVHLVHYSAVMVAVQIVDSPFLIKMYGTLVVETSGTVAGSIFRVNKTQLFDSTVGDLANVEREVALR